MFSREIVPVAPEAVGVHRDRLHQAIDVLRSGVGTAFPGATLCAFRRNKCFLDLAFGTHGGSSPARLESLYDLASLTKPVATASSVLTLVERGKLSYTDTLGLLFGEENAGGWKAVTVKQLVTHISGLPAWLPLYKSGLGLESAVRTILATHADDRPKPGGNYEYSCLNYILLGRIVESVSGKSLSAFARENIFAPLGMIDTMFQPDALTQKRTAPTQSEEGPEDTTPVTLCGSVHDGNARGIGGVSGNAGLFGTARDIARFGNALLHPGEVRLFGDPTLARIWENQIPGVGGQSLLFYTDGNGYNPSGDLLSPRTVGHSGYTGTILTIDPANDLVVSVLTNSVYPTENGVGKPGWLALRRRFLNALAAAITG
ncbi:MAG: beta-lactamase family protein [Akkermansiaceae bacterium]|nr:beta-lactamase family protein [Armatimonadota bacterium]